MSLPFSDAGNVNNRGNNGYYWSATQNNADYGWNVYWYSNYANSNNSNNANYGMPVRLFLPWYCPVCCVIAVAPFSL